MVPFKGKLAIKVGMPDKSFKFEVKFFQLCDSKTGYCKNFSSYAGKDNREAGNIGKTGKIVMDLEVDLHNTNHHLFVDNFYTSQIGHLHDGVILLLGAESCTFFLSYSNLVIPARFKKQKHLFAQESKTLKDSGRSSKMPPSCKWSLLFPLLRVTGILAAGVARPRKGYPHEQLKRAVLGKWGDVAWLTSKE